MPDAGVALLREDLTRSLARVTSTLAGADTEEDGNG